MDSKNGTKRVEVRAEGRVQGVGFRGSVMEKAGSLGVRGWVRNTSDGAVEAVFEGEEVALKKMVAFCRAGPGPAHVERLEEKWKPFSGKFEGFEVTF